MNAYQVVLTSGATTIVQAEDYNADPVLGLTFVDQFGNTVVRYAPSAYNSVAIVNPTAPGPAVTNAYQPTIVSSSPGQVVTENDPTYNDGNL